MTSYSQPFSQARYTVTASSEAGEGGLCDRSSSDPRQTVGQVFNSRVGRTHNRARRGPSADIMGLWLDEHCRGLATNPFSQELLVASDRKLKLHQAIITLGYNNSLLFLL